MAQTTNNISTTATKQEQHSLSIQVRLDGFSFFVRDVSSGAIRDYKSIVFDQRVDPNGLLPVLDKIYTEHAVLLNHYQKVDVIYINSLFTLVPEPLFDEAHLSDYLKFNTRLLKTDFVAYDKITSCAVMNVYIPYTNLNNFLFDRYGSFTYHHGISLLIREQAKDLSSLPDKMVINVHPSSFDLICFKTQKLVLANAFEYQTPEDFVYYILFTVEQLELDPETIQLQLTGHIQEGDALYERIYTYIRNVKLLPSIANTIPQDDYLLSTLV